MKTVKVMCVWPVERGPKNDCRGGTNVVWAGHGDVQDYPAHLWPKLAEHPDVWKLHDTEADARIAEARQKAEKAAADARAAAEEADRIALAEQKRVADEARAAAEAGKQTGTEVVTVTSVNDAVAATRNYAFSADELKALEPAKIHEIGAARGYDLHPRLKVENLHIKFLEAQAADEQIVAGDAADSEGGEG